MKINRDHSNENLKKKDIYSEFATERESASLANGRDSKASRKM